MENLADPKAFQKGCKKSEISLRFGAMNTGGGRARLHRPAHLISLEDNMAVATEKTSDTFDSITAGVPINCDWPMYEDTDVVVVYGNQSLVAVMNTDYTVTLSAPTTICLLSPRWQLLLLRLRHSY